MATEPVDGPRPTPARSPVKQLFDDTRKRLVETGTRNRLVHVNRANTRGNVLNIVNEQSDDVYEILDAGRSMRFLALGRDRDDDDQTLRLVSPGDNDFDADRFKDSQLETRLGPDALQKKLLKISREAQTAEEEQGVNILYLAFGFLTWFEDKSSSLPREAPLLLLPVELVRNQRTSTYDVRARDEDILTNLPLQQRLKEDFGIALPEVEVNEGWTPTTYFDQIQEVIAERNRWSIDRDGIQLGFFSFSKLLMFLDLALEAWPDDMLQHHELTKKLLYEGFDGEDRSAGYQDSLDDLLPPEKLFHVVDADASQAQVIEEVRSGKNLVVQGPPGTGKSQTITNIIAAAAKEGKTVLFVAEKMAALSVVHDRLVRVGLRDICLELHSKSANKKAVLAELARTLSAASAVPNLPSAPTPLREARDRLNELAEALHRPIGRSGESAFSSLARQSRFIGMDVPPPSITGDGLAELSRDEEVKILADLTGYGALLTRAGPLERHPFMGVGNLDLQPVDLARVKLLLTTACETIATLLEAIGTPCAAGALNLVPTLAAAAPLSELLERVPGLPQGAESMAVALLNAPDVERLHQGVEAGAAWREARDSAEQIFTESAFTVSTSGLRTPLVGGTLSFFARWGSSYRTASRELAGLLKAALPKTASERLALVDVLNEVAALRARLMEDQGYCARVLGDHWRGERTDFAKVLSVANWSAHLRSSSLNPDTRQIMALATAAALVPEWLSTLRATYQRASTEINELVDLLRLRPASPIEDVALSAIAAQFSAMAKDIDRYSEYAQLSKAYARLASGPGAEIVAQVHSGAKNATEAVIELKFARAERLWQAALASSSLLRDLGQLSRHELVSDFARLERERLSENVTTIRAGHLAQVPQGAMGEMKVIRGEIGKKKAHIALRRLFSSAPTAIQRIKPVLLMSPLSVAQFLPPGALSFDLLVIDEASQVRPEDALGAIARASQIVVVGDQKQLPPSAFFDRLLADEDDGDEDVEEAAGELLGGAAKLASMESILSLCEARGLPSRMLKWHYRSRDPSLIAVSNREFYENDLVLPPSPLQEDPAYGLCFTRVDGVYDKGGKRDNRKEGEAIVGRVAEHAKSHPELSLGIVTFSFAQRNLITELLEIARRSNPTLDEFLREGQSEDLFVKNIENVQGDERDVILVSVGYGPTMPGGRLNSMSFGPINGEGGERRLNVLFTRARLRCEVFASFDPGDIDPSRVSKEGPRILRRFLEYAKHGRADDSAPTGEEAETPFEEDVAEVIRGFGFLADPQVGSAGFRIDMGIRHPDRPGVYVLAVECDGATYHSALWARERDRLRQDVLEHLGWRFHRIWSTDWFYNRRAEIERLRLALIEAREAAEAGIRIDGANRARSAEAPTVQPASWNLEIPTAVEREMPGYVRADLPVHSTIEPHEANVGVLAQLAHKIVEIEGPIHVEEVARRIAASFGKEKAGSRIVAAAKSALARAQRLDPDLLSDGIFWFSRSQAEAPPIRNRAAENGSTLKAAHISMLEIGAALKQAREDNAGGSDADLVRSAARMMGFRRVGPDLQIRLSEGLAL